MTWTAVVPVAFFSPANVRMTEEFLRALMDEPGLDQALVYFNGGLSIGKMMMLETARKDPRLRVVDAKKWPFYRMWNRGIRAGRLYSPVVGVLNNDIEWPRGALAGMAGVLDSSPPDVIAVIPNLDLPITVEPSFDEREESPPGKHRGLTCCWMIRPQLAKKLPTIDERYKSWYGDNELARLIERADLKILRLPGVPVRHQEESTMGLVPRVNQMRRDDRRLYKSKWGRP